MKSAQKDLFIEQLRGIAVLLVVLYHYTNRIPHTFMGAAYPPSIEFFSGKIGVYLFFIISGLLIAKTLERTSSLGEFFAMRASRIWPLFILACVITFVWAHCFSTPVVPEGIKDFSVKGRTVLDLIGNIFFLEELGFDWIDGAYWSILVELKYYFIVGLFAYLFRDRFVEFFARAAIILGTLDISLYLLSGGEGYTVLNKILHGLFIAQYLPFFALGMLIYKRTYNLLFLVCANLSLIQMLQGLSTNPDFTVRGTLEFLTLFSLYLIFDFLLVKGKITAFFGTYSYSIYLFHQVIGLSLIMMMTPVIGINYSIIAAFIFVLALSVSLSWLAEWRFRQLAFNIVFKLGKIVYLDKLKLAAVK